MTEVEKPDRGAGGVEGGAGGFFGAALAPSLLEICGGRLSEVHWFRADWQRGGALTGYAQWRGDDGATRPAVVKLPVPPQELDWLERLQPERQAAGQVTPRVFAGARSLGGYDLAWVVMERLKFGPLDHAWGSVEIDLLCQAAARFYAAAESYPVVQPPRDEHWPELLKRSRKALREGDLAESQRWNVALKSAQKKFDKLLAAWETRDATHWCHGDLHMGNAMTLAPPPGGPALLFDMARVHTGHWIEDAVYFEHLFWCRPQRLGGRDPVKLIAHARKQLHLRPEPHWPQLANIRRVLLASAAPAEQQQTQPNPHHLHAALVVLENMLPRV